MPKRKKYGGKYGDHKGRALPAAGEDLGGPSPTILSASVPAVNNGGGCPVSIGDRLQFVPDFAKINAAHLDSPGVLRQAYEPVMATVVSINRKGRFYRVEYRLSDGSLIHESVKF